tara:strand:+ start:191 stop:589 length:399 start_codon:yes stop_codon:yes gene_type:complete
MKKGDLVKLDTEWPEISDIIEWGMRGEEYLASRPATEEEREEWRVQKQKDIQEAHERGDDTFHIAFDSGGEPRVPPRSVSVALPIDRIYIVERARCRVQLGWGNPVGGMAKILDTSTGETAYVKRDMLKVVD